MKSQHEKLMRNGTSPALIGLTISMALMFLAGVMGCTPILYGYDVIDERFKEQRQGSGGYRLVTDGVEIRLSVFSYRPSDVGVTLELKNLTHDRISYDPSQLVVLGNDQPCFAHSSLTRVYRSPEKGKVELRQRKRAAVKYTLADLACDEFLSQLNVRIGGIQIHSGAEVRDITVDSVLVTFRGR